MHPQHHPLLLLSRPNFRSITPTASYQAKFPQHHTYGFLPGQISTASTPTASFQAKFPQHHPYGFLPGRISTATPNSGLPKGRHSSPSAPTAFLKAVIRSISFYGLFEAVIQQLHPPAAFPRAVIHHPQLLRPYQRRNSSPSATRLTIKPNLPSASLPPRLFLRAYIHQHIVIKFYNLASLKNICLQIFF